MQFFDPEVAVDSGGRVVVAATSCCSHSIGCGVTSTDPYPPPCDVTIWRLQPDGQLDASWGDSGRKLVHNAFNFADALTVDAEDRVLLGSSRSGPASVLRFKVNGPLDSTFSNDGIAKFKLNDNTPASPLRIGADPSGTITVAVDNDKRDVYGVGRLTSAGVLDSTYGLGGTVTRRCAKGCSPSSAAVDHGEVAIVVDGWVGRSQADRWLRLARVNAAGTVVKQRALTPSRAPSTRAH